MTPTPPPPHTPGPWHVEEHPLTRQFDVRDNKGRIVAGVIRREGPDGMRNAVLIASAPALEAEVERLRDAVIMAVTRARNLLRSPGEPQRALWSIMADDLEAALARDREMGGT